MRQRLTWHLASAAPVTDASGRHLLPSVNRPPTASTAGACAHLELMCTGDLRGPRGENIKGNAPQHGVKETTSKNRGGKQPGILLPTTLLLETCRGQRGQRSGPSWAAPGCLRPAGHEQTTRTSRNTV